MRESGRDASVAMQLVLGLLPFVDADFVDISQDRDCAADEPQAHAFDEAPASPRAFRHAQVKRDMAHLPFPTGYDFLRAALHAEAMADVVCRAKGQGSERNLEISGGMNGFADRAIAAGDDGKFALLQPFRL